MRRSRKPMALRAMVFLFLLIGTIAFSGCGEDAYEAVDTVQSETADAGSEKPEGISANAGTALSSDSAEKASAEKIYVYVCGAVNSPGVYELPEHARVYEAIEAAGGLREDADSVHTNQAKVLTDGEQITVLTTEEAKTAPAADNGENAGNAAEENGAAAMVNINTAGASELTTLSGIGQSRANDIISYREEHGPFEKTEDIMKVTGIKTALYTKIKDHICV